MEWVKRLTGRIVALDTAPLIYYVEGHPIFIKKVRPFFEALAKGDLIGLTSAVTVTETLVKPFKSNRLDLISKHLDFMAAYISVIPLDTEIAKTAAKLRAEHNLRAFDAI